jgi:hypothetical protein
VEKKDLAGLHIILNRIKIACVRLQSTATEMMVLNKGSIFESIIGVRVTTNSRVNDIGCDIYNFINELYYITEQLKLFEKVVTGYFLGIQVSKMLICIEEVEKNLCDIRKLFEFLPEYQYEIGIRTIRRSSVRKSIKCILKCRRKLLKLMVSFERTI